MKFALATTVLALAVGLVKSGLPSSYSFPASEWKKYHCITLDRYLKKIAEPCAHNCLDLILDGPKGIGRVDGCAIDDMVCHCANTQILIDQLIPCIEGPTSPNATCSAAQIGTQIGIVADLCTFFNATGYADYLGCDAKLQFELQSEFLSLATKPNKTKRSIGFFA